MDVTTRTGQSTGMGANLPPGTAALCGADTEDTNVTKKKIGVLGAGTWGMALARMLCVSGHEVTVWSALPEEIDTLSTTRVHKNLPGMTIPQKHEIAMMLIKRVEIQEDTTRIYWKYDL